MSVILQRAVNLLALPVTHVALNPVITAALLWVLTKGPPQLRSQLTSRIAALRDPKRHEQILKGLKWCLALGVAKLYNKQLNHIAMNAGRLQADKARWEWSKEVAVITGGCSGIGELVAKRLLDRGIKVAVLDIQELPRSLLDRADVRFFECDITDPYAVYATAHKVKKTFGAPTILINNAGVLASHSILSTSDDFLRKIFDVNVLSNWYTTKAFLPDMLKNNKGHIMTVASTASYIGVGGMADYTATKAAVLSFHEALNQELKHHYNSPNILTTSIHPNWIRTPLLAPVEAELKAQGSPMLEPTYVADKIVQSILSCSSGQVFLPSGAGSVSLLRGTPNWLQETLRSATSKTIYNTVQ